MDNTAERECILRNFYFLLIVLTFNFFMNCKQKETAEKNQVAPKPIGDDSGSQIPEPDPDEDDVKLATLSAQVEAIEGKFCVELKRPDGAAVTNKFLCSDEDVGLSFENSEEASDLDCVQYIDKEAAQLSFNSFFCTKKAADVCVRHVEGEEVDSNLTCVNFQLEGVDTSLNNNRFCSLKSKESTCPAKPVVEKAPAFSGITEMKWVHDGQIPPMACIPIIESSDPAGIWADNFLCFDKDYGFQWSKDGPIAQKQCMKVSDSQEDSRWDNNFLCSENDNYCLRYSDNGPIQDMECLNINEPRKPIWNNNFLCRPKAGGACPELPANGGAPQFKMLPGLQWSQGGALPGKHCIKINEPSDPHTWDDNFLCMNAAPESEISWSYTGYVPPQICTKVVEHNDVDKAVWLDNYLCSSDDRYCMRWSITGPLADMDCLRIHEDAEPSNHSWNDNYLCVRKDQGTHCPNQ